MKKLIAVPTLLFADCTGCVGNGGKCPPAGARPKSNPDCSVNGDVIYIRDTDKGKAAYIALKLVGVKDDE